MQFIYLLIVHWIADFVLQTRQQANNKSSSNWYLLQHILVYSGCLLITFGLKVALVNGIAHYITDFFTSRASKYFYSKQDIHKFFVVIGFDQLLHVIVLYISITYMT